MGKAGGNVRGEKRGNWSVRSWREEAIGKETGGEEEVEEREAVIREGRDKIRVK